VNSMDWTRHGVIKLHGSLLCYIATPRR
jgi:hypothetical protein